jgi:glycosyltransferase 2 family protein
VDGTPVDASGRAGAPRAKEPARRRWLRVGARLLGLGLVAWVLATQVRWTDEVVRADGATLRGEVVAAPGGWVVRGRDGVERAVADADVARDRFGGREVPRIAFGLPTLVGRLARSAPTVALVLGGLVALALLTAWRWRWLVRALGLALSASEAVRYTFYGIFFNLFVPGSTGGDVVKAWYAARRTGRATKAVVSVLVDRLVGLFALVLFAAAVLFVARDREGFATPRVLVGAVLGGAVVAGVLVLSRRVRRALGLSAVLRRLPLQRVWTEVDAAVRLYRAHAGSLVLGLLVSLVNHAGTASCAWLLARALGLREVGLSDCLALIPVVSLLSAIPLLPGGWGVGEMAFAAFFVPLGLAPSEAVAWSIVFRLSILASGLPGAALWLLAREHPRPAEMAADVERAADEAGALAGDVAPPAAGR